MKLKVGKTKPKAANATETGFRAKAIVLKNQSLNTAAPSSSDQIANHLALLGSRSETQRKNSLNALANAAASAHSLPTAVLLPHCLHLVTDGSGGVRESLLKLLRCVRIGSCTGFEDKIVLHIQTGLTHIAADVCNTALDMLDWAMDTLGLPLVTCSGGWFKILRCFMLVFGWSDSRMGQELRSGPWTNSGYALEKLNKDKAVISKALERLAKFLSLGLTEPRDSKSKAMALQPHFKCHVKPHLVPRRSGAFAHLGLFGTEQADDTRMLETRFDRQHLLRTTFLENVEKGLAATRHHGGEVGRGAAIVQRTLVDGLGNDDKWICR